MSKPRVKSCADCPTMIVAESQRCKPCAMRVVATGDRARLARLQEGWQRKLADPAQREAVREHMRLVTKKRTEAALGWCPPEYRDEWQAFRNKRGARRMSAEERRATFLAKIKAEVEGLSPFERQERALRNGARLIANQRLYR